MSLNRFEKTRRLFRRAWTIFFGSLACGLVLLSSVCRAGEPVELKPLFPVALEHEFSDSDAVLDEVRSLILKEYYTGSITEAALNWAAICGMLRHVSPPQNPGLSKIWTAREYDVILNALKGVKISLGIKSTYNPVDGSLTVTEVLSDSPARSKLQPLDRILRIDDEPLKGRSVEEINVLLEGDADTTVRLTVNRDIEIFDTMIKRRVMETRPLTVARLTDRMALMRVRQFTAGISGRMKKELARLKQAGVTGIIIDLRNNPGGVFAEALRIVELFLPEKHILLRTYQRKTKLQNYVSSNKTPFDFKMAVLVNQKTASSAEILAAALQDNKKAFIVGVRTFGKGVFEKTFTLENGYRVKFITGAMYSPKGKSWQTKGIIPDFLVEQDDNILSELLKLPPRERLSKDVAMITAYKLIRR